MSLAEKLFGSFSDRELKKINPLTKQVLALEGKYQAMSDAELQAQTPALKQKLADGKTLDDILPDAFAVCREAAWRVLGMKHFPVQVTGGIALHRGDIAEMQTGEGKTLVATLPAYLNALTGEGVHIVTVNDYLAKRDSEWMGKLYRWLGLSVGLITVACVLLITVYLVISGIPATRKIGLIPFLFGKVWDSTAAEPSFGILPFILTSVYGTAGAILLGVPVGFLTAVYLAKLAPAGVKRVMQAAVSMLAGIPSVVYGLVGMLILVPGIRKIFHVPDGSSLLAAIIVLAIMILPSIIKVSVTALEAVPKEYEDASLALGATPVETYFKVSVPAARGGIAAAVVLGVGRAIGEAMAVMMVSGNVANMPSLFQSVRFLTTGVASEMSYSSGLQRQALFSIALVLFLFIMLINATLNFFLKRDKGGAA